MNHPILYGIITGAVLVFIIAVLGFSLATLLETEKRFIDVNGLAVQVDVEGRVICSPGRES